MELKNCREEKLWQFLYHLVLDSISAFRLRPKMHMRSAVHCQSLNNSIWFRFDWNVQHYFVSIRKTFIDIFVALTELRKKNYSTHCTTKKHAKFYFCIIKPQNFVCIKKQRKILLARGLSIRQLPARGCWNVTLLLLFLLQKKCEYHRTCCDYVVVAACQDCSTWNKRKKLQHFYQLVVNMFEICEKAMHARSGAGHCCDGKGWAARVQCEPLLTRAVESEVLSSDSDSGQFRLSDSDSGPTPTFSCISYLKW